MTDIQRHLPSDAHRAAVARSGFDAQNPGQRRPVRSPEAEAILAAQGRATPPHDREQSLLRARGAAGGALGQAFDAFAIATALLGFMDPAVPQASAAPYDAAATPLQGLGFPLNLLLIAGLALACFPAVAVHFFTRGAPMSDPDPLTATPTTPWRWRLDGASRKGAVREDNQDAWRRFAVAPDRACLIVCDGAGGVAGGKLAAEVAAEALATSLDQACSAPVLRPPADILEAAIRHARHAVAAQEQAGITTAIVALLDADHIAYATLGDGDLAIIWPDGMTQRLLAPHHVLGQPPNILAAFIGHGCVVPPRIGSARLEPGAVVLAMTDGAGDLLPLDQIAAARDQYRRLIADPDTPLADRILAELEAARDPRTNAYLHSDNMTLVIATLSREEADHADD